jgi:nitrous oxide reductase
MPKSQAGSGPAKASRRGFMIGAAVAGAATATVVGTQLTSPDPAAADAKPPTPERGGGYHVTEHIKRYYRTTLV